MRRQFNEWFSKKKDPSPLKQQEQSQQNIMKHTQSQNLQRPQSITIHQQISDSAAVKTGTLPENFHQRVVDLEMNIEGREYKEDEGALVTMISELMGLYSAAIEFYNRETDEDNQTYYVEKLSKLNDDIRAIVDRQNRIIQRRTQNTIELSKQTLQQKNRPMSTHTLPTPKGITQMDRKRIQDDLKLKLFEKNKEQEKNSTTQTDKIIEKTEQATVALKKDMLTQNEQLQQRLAERRRSKVGRASSVGDQSLSFNFGKVNQSQRETSLGGSIIDQQTGSGIALKKIISNQQPVVQSSRMVSPIKHSNTAPIKDTFNTSSMNLLDETTSQNKSATSQGTGLANKIGLAISRILSNTNNSRGGETDEDVADLIALIQELNHHTELTVKLSSTNKITKILNEVGNQEFKKDIFAEIQQNKVASLNFKSKMKLEMKSLTIDPQVRSILDECLQKLEKLQEEKDAEIEEFMEEHAELKFKMNQDIKKKFNMKIALATKAKDEEQIKSLNEGLKEEQKRSELELQEKSTIGKNDIKDRFNLLAQQIQIDTQALVSALLANGKMGLQQS